MCPTEVRHMNTYKQHAQNRSIGWSTWHIQWCTKYRYKIFGNKKMRNACKIFLQESANKHKFKIYDLEVDIDHIHVIASLPLTMTPLLAIQYLKGMSSRGLFLEFPKLRKIYRKSHIWSPGKFIGSVGHITLDKAKKYLDAHHAKMSGESQLCSFSAKLPVGQSFRAGRMSIFSS